LSHVEKPAPLLPLRAQPPFGLAYDPDLIEAIQHETRDMLLPELQAKVLKTKERGMALGATVEPMSLQEIGMGKPGPGRGIKTADNVMRLSNGKAQYGNSAAYYAARLRRDYPDIADALAQGKYLSAHAAAKAAGFVTDPTPLPLVRRAGGASGCGGEGGGALGLSPSIPSGADPCA
jgi:hypothetical protein